MLVPSAAECLATIVQSNIDYISASHRRLYDDYSDRTVISTVEPYLDSYKGARASRVDVFVAGMEGLEVVSERIRSSFPNNPQLSNFRFETPDVTVGNRLMKNLLQSTFGGDLGFRRVNVQVATVKPDRYAYHTLVVSTEERRIYHFRHQEKTPQI